MLRGIRIAAFVVAAATLGLASSAHAQNMRRACKGDAARLCPGMKPGSAEFIQCLKDNKEQLSPKCKDAAEQMKGGGRQQPAPEQGNEPGEAQPK
jgi:hypothetical protein